MVGTRGMIKFPEVILMQSKKKTTSHKFDFQRHTQRSQSTYIKLDIRQIGT